MNNARWWIVLGVVVWAGLSHGAGYYWDVNGTLTGSGGPTPNGVWDGANTFWNTDSAGGAGTLVSNPATSDTLTLSAGTDATGTYAIAVSGTQNAGTIVFKDGSPTIAGGTLSFAATGVITLNSGITGSIGSCIAGVGTVLYKNGTGTLTLTGTNVYTGTTQIYGATESTLVLSNTQGYAISGNVYMGWPGGGGSGGTLRLAANNQIPPTSVITFGHAYGGQHAYFVLNGFSTSVAGLNNGSDLGGEIYNGSAADATITLAGSGVYDFGPISGYFGNIWDGATGKLGFVKSGSGTQTFSGNNSYTGGTTINAGWMRVATSTALGGAGSTITFGGGTLQAGASVSLGNSTLNLGTGNAVIDTVGNTLTLTGILGGGALTKVGTGTLTLNGINAFTSPLTNSAGALVVGGAGKLGAGSYAADILNGGAFVFNSSAGQTLGGVISGSGSLTVSGTGTLTLTGNNTYGSPTTVLAGTLCVNTPGGNGLAGDVRLVGGTLGGTGTVAGTVVVNNLGHVAPGNGVGVQSYGSFTLNTGSFLDLEFDGTTNDQVVVNSPGGLTLTGGWVSFYNNGAATPYSTPGTYNLIQYAGTIGGSGVSALGVANPVAGVSWRFDTAGGWVVATLTAQKVWDGGGIDNNLATPENWNPDGTPVEYDGLAFAGTTRLTPNNNYAANTKFTGITFNGGAGAFTLGGNAMGLSGAVLNNSSVAQTLNMDIQLAGNLVVTNVGAASLTLGGTVSESGGSRALMKNGSGTLTLTGTGTNTISGLVTVNAGGLGLAKAGNIAAVQGSVTMVNNEGNYLFTTADYQFGAGCVLTLSGGN